MVLRAQAVRENTRNHPGNRIWRLSLLSSPSKPKPRGGAGGHFCTVTLVKGMRRREKQKRRGEGVRHAGLCRCLRACRLKSCPSGCYGRPHASILGSVCQPFNQGVSSPPPLPTFPLYLKNIFRTSRTFLSRPSPDRCGPRSSFARNGTR